MAINSKDKKTFPVISGTLYCIQPLKLINYCCYYQRENMNMPSRWSCFFTAMPFLVMENETHWVNGFEGVGSWRVGDSFTGFEGVLS